MVVGMQSVAVSRSLEIDAAPSKVLEILQDPDQLPRWAPGFAREVRQEGEVWIAAHPLGFDLPFTLRVNREHGTADVIVSETPPRGAYLRALATGTGCHLTLTIVVPAADGVDEAGQVDVAEAELRAIAELAA